MAKKKTASRKATPKKKSPARKKVNKPKAKKHVYFFGGKKADGDGSQKALLGGKGANLSEMSRIGLPVPAGMAITTEVCTYYYANKKIVCRSLNLFLLIIQGSIRKILNVFTCL